MSKTTKPKMIDKEFRTHKNFISIKEKNILGMEQTKYVDIRKWWKSHKNSLVKEENDMVPISYDHKSSWEVITNSIMDPRGPEGKSWWNEI